MRTPFTPLVERCACGCDACGGSIPAGLDLARARETEFGLYHVELATVPACAGDAAALAIFVSGRLRAAGAEMEVSISGARPRCRCAAPTELAVTRHGPGQFATAPFSFTSPGWWVLRVTVSGAAGWDAATFNLAIE